MSRKITNNTGYSLYYRGTTQYDVTPTTSYTYYELENGESVNRSLECIFATKVVNGKPEVSKIKLSHSGGEISTTGKQGNTNVYLNTGDTETLTLENFATTFSTTASDTILTNASSTTSTTYKVNTTLTNCTITPTSTEIEEGTRTTFTVTANDGYEFTTTPTINGSAMTKTSDTVYTSTITVNADVTIIANATAISTATTYNVTTTLTNCTITPTSTTVSSDTTVTFIVTANDGYTFRTAPTLNGNAMTKSSDTSYHYTLIPDSDITIIANAVLEDYTESITYNLQNANATPLSLVLGTATTITITADNGYTLVSATGTYYTESGDYESITFTISDDSSTATATVTVPNDSLGVGNHIITISNTATQAPITKVLNDLIAVYIPTDEELGKISEKQFITVEGQVYAISEFITSYKKLYIPKTAINIVGKNYAVLGYYDTKIEVDTASDFIVTIDCGDVTIDAIHNNTYDFTDTTINIYIPFIGLTELNASEVVGKTINLQYKINIITAECVAIITVKETDITKIIQENNGVCGFSVPYKTSDILWSLYNSNAEITGYLKYSKTPTVYENYHDEISSNNIYNGSQWVIIGDMNGFTQFSEVNLETIADINYTEMDELTNILMKGVII